MTVGGETLTLTTTVAPDDATDKTVTWTTSDANVATVANGVVTAVAAGTATITVTATNGTDDTSDDKTATCNVTVTAPATYTVSLADGTDDAANWSTTPNPATAGQTVTIKYNGLKKVKSIKAVKKAASATPTLNLTNPAVGQVIGSDGKNYATNATLPDGVTKVAMIAYVNGSNGLAIALADEEDAMYWATAKSTCEAKTPAFTGGTWILPSKDEWNQMFKANGDNEESYTDLNTALTTAGGTALQKNDGYWSSTQVDEGLAWLVNLKKGGVAIWDSSIKVTEYLVRACLAF